jgi:hypothetical protein
MRRIKKRIDTCHILTTGMPVACKPKLTVMKQAIDREILEVMSSAHYRPAVSMVMPFEPQMNGKEGLKHRLKLAADNVEKELTKNYGDVEQVGTVMSKLRNLVNHLNFDVYKKSVALFVSPVFEKVLYMEIPVEEKVIIDESFEIRDLVFCKQQMHRYLVLVLSGGESRIYLGNERKIVQMISNTHESVASVKNDPAERVGNFTDAHHHKEVLMEKFLLHIDNRLDIVLKAYQLPVFVMGPQRVLGHFKQVTRHNNALVGFVKGNYEDMDLPHLHEIIEPHVRDWKKIRQKNLLNKLEEAASMKRMVSGIQDVWKEAVHKKGRMLLVEKDYRYTARKGVPDDIIYRPAESDNPFSFIQDAVDDVIEKVLENGGDVEFVENGFLRNYHHIALLLYY